MLADYEKHWYWLASAPGMSFEKIALLVQDGVRLEELFSHPERIDFSLHKILPAKDNLLRRAHMDVIEQELSELSKKQVSVLPILNKNYPLSLKEIMQPPAMLYVKGDIARLTAKAVTMVGSRSPSRSGFKNVRRIAKELAQSGVTIISGMARGIDSASHLGALDGGGVTVAVLGSGVDVVYPRENKKLYEQIIKDGAVLSEYPLGMPPLGTNFPIRNRIMNGMGRAVIVGEGGLKSGTSITVRHAGEENRDIFAVPSEEKEDRYQLPNKLILDGAFPCREAKDVLSYYGWDALQAPAQENKKPAGLDFFEGRLYNLLLKGDMSLEELMEQADSDVKTVNLTLTKMEIKGFVERLAGNRFGIKN